MKKWFKISLMVLACLVIFQMFFRYDIKQTTTHSSSSTKIDGSYAVSSSMEFTHSLVVDRLTGKSYNFGGSFSLFPYPHETK
jgi:hypothetical protein